MAAILLHVQAAQNALLAIRRPLQLLLRLCTALLASFSPSAVAQSFDEDAAVSLAKKSGCLKCHSVDKRKKAPSYKEIAAKFRGRSDAETVLLKHLTEAPTVQTAEGEDETHETVKTDNKAEVVNVVRWVLSR